MNWSNTAEPVLRRDRLWLVLGWLLVVAIVYLSLTRHPIEIDVTQGDKVGHLLAYGALMAWWSQLRGYHLRLALACVLLGGMLEILQSFTDYRQGDWLDLAADSVGVGIGWLTTRLQPGWLAAIDRRLAP
jgi:VanZ family protein